MAVLLLSKTCNFYWLLKSGQSCIQFYDEIENNLNVFRRAVLNDLKSVQEPDWSGMDMYKLMQMNLPVALRECPKNGIYVLRKKSKENPLYIDFLFWMFMFEKCCSSQVETHAFPPWYTLKSPLMFRHLCSVMLIKTNSLKLVLNLVHHNNVLMLNHFYWFHWNWI